MSPQELERMNKLERLVASLLNVENLAFKASLERRLDFLSGSFQLADATNVSPTAPTSGQVLKWNGTAWAPAVDNIA